jgi:hypothetical protein
MKKDFLTITGFISSLKEGKIDFQKSKTNDFGIVAVDSKGKYVQSFISAIGKPKNKSWIKIGFQYFIKQKKVYI